MQFLNYCFNLIVLYNCIIVKGLYLCECRKGRMLKAKQKFFFFKLTKNKRQRRWKLKKNNAWLYFTPQTKEMLEILFCMKKIKPIFRTNKICISDAHNVTFILFILK